MRFLIILIFSTAVTAEIANKPTPSDRLHVDGRLTGPGTVYFQLENISFRNEKVDVVGAVFANNGGQPIILKNTAPTQLVPKHVQQISLVVSREEFQQWSSQYPQLTLGITYPPGFDASGWNFHSGLKPEDFSVLKPGQFLIRGQFTH